jgi:hypothetical protein
MTLRRRTRSPSPGAFVATVVRSPHDVEREIGDRLAARDAVPRRPDVERHALLGDDVGSLQHVAPVLKHEAGVVELALHRLPDEGNVVCLVQAAEERTDHQLVRPGETLIGKAEAQQVVEELDDPVEVVAVEQAVVEARRLHALQTIRPYFRIDLAEPAPLTRQRVTYYMQTQLGLQIDTAGKNQAGFLFLDAEPGTAHTRRAHRTGLTGTLHMQQPPPRQPTGMPLSPTASMPASSVCVARSERSRSCCQSRP